MFTLYSAPRTAKSTASPTCSRLGAAPKGPLREPLKNRAQDREAQMRAWKVPENKGGTDKITTPHAHL